MKLDRVLLAAFLGAACAKSDAPRTGEVPAPPSRTAAPDLATVPVDAAAAPAVAVVPRGGPPAALACLERHYTGHAEEREGTWRLVLPDGTSVPYDDGRTKKMADRIASPDVEDVFAIAYPAGAVAPVTDAESDPGRARIEPLFRATYGEDARAVSALLVGVTIAGKTVPFHRRAAPALARVAARIDLLLRSEPGLSRFFRSLGGTFATRAIAGTDRTSAHAWGIAIDIDTSMADYWRNRPGAGWRNRIPQPIVDAFEAEGFVWGGRWFHYDTMHFEWRPELFDPGCRRMER